MKVYIFGSEIILSKALSGFKKVFVITIRIKINALGRGNTKSFINKYNEILSSYYKSPYFHLTDSKLMNYFLK